MTYNKLTLQFEQAEKNCGILIMKAGKDGHEAQHNDEEIGEESGGVQVQWCGLISYHLRTRYIGTILRR